MSQCGPVNQRSHHARGICLLKFERPWTNSATAGKKWRSQLQAISLLELPIYFISNVRMVQRVCSLECLNVYTVSSIHAEKTCYMHWGTSKPSGGHLYFILFSISAGSLFVPLLPSTCSHYSHCHGGVYTCLHCKIYNKSPWQHAKDACRQWRSATVNVLDNFKDEDSGERNGVC